MWLAECRRTPEFELVAQRVRASGAIACLMFIQQTAATDWKVGAEFLKLAFLQFFGTRARAVPHRAPLRATPHQARPDPVAAPATPRALAAQQRLVADMRELHRQGVLIMQCAPDGDAISVLVPVADDQTVATLTRRYGPVLVSAWLERA